jgi:hypothetical protein
VLAVGQRNFDVGESEVAMLVRHEALARHSTQHVEHALVEHLPGAHLLLDHLRDEKVAALLDLHVVSLLLDLYLPSGRATRYGEIRTGRGVP